MNHWAQPVRRDLAYGARQFVWLWVVGALASAPGLAADTRFQFSQTEMAVPVKVVLYAPTQALATRIAQAAFDRIAALNQVFTDYDTQSELMRLSSTSGEGIAVPVSEDLWRVLSRAQQISRMSAGAFDISVGPVVRLWRRARRQKELPPNVQLHETLSRVGYEKIRLFPADHKVELTTKGMRLDLGGIAKGYILAAALETMRQQGVRAAMIHAGGDSALGDPPPGRSGWRIGVGMLKSDAPPLEFLSLANTSVASSGDMWQFVEIGGRRYSHIVDPRTGVGLTGRSNVTVVAPDGATADALATAVSVLGHERGLRLIDATPDAAALVLHANGDQVEVHHSKRWGQLRKWDEGRRKSE
jgi:thiamine biosynthesis lipoprotein